MNAGRARYPDTIARASLGLMIALFAMVSLAWLWRVMAVVGMRVPLDPNEGWNAYHATAAITGRALYPGADAYLVNNYPPLSFYVVGMLSRVTGDAIVAGRSVSLAAFLFAAIGIGQAARRMGCRLIEAATASLLFAAWLLVGSDYVGMDDPQLLGHAIEIGALLLVLRGRVSDIAAAFLFVVALFVKHNLVAMPFAVAFWLALEDRARALRFAAAGAAFLIVGLILFRIAFGSSLFSHLASARLYMWGLLAQNVRAWLVWGAIPIAIVATLAALHRHDRFVAFCALYAALAFALGVAFAGGAGVDVNVFFDAAIALSLGAGLALNRFAPRGPGWTPCVASALVLALGFGLYQASNESWSDPDFWSHPMADEAAQTRDDIAFLRARRGPALCESLSLCYWAGKEPEVDTFNVGQELATGARPDDDLIRSIEAHRYSGMAFDTLEPFALGPRVRSAVLKAYRADHADDIGAFFVPR